MNRSLPATAILLLLAIPSSRADQARATLCAASLQPDALLVFKAVSASPQPGLPLRRVLEARVRELVFMDHLSMNAARPAAEAASDCLRIARNCTGNTC